MKKIICLLLVTAVAAGIGPHSLSWGDSLIGSTGSVGVAKGYFVLRRAGIWLRIDSASDCRGAGPRR